MRKINYLQILLHFIASCFFIFSFRAFSSAYNIKILKLVTENGVENVMKNSEKYGITISDIWYLTFTTEISNLIGIFVAFIISILISIKKKWSIWNSFIVLILSFLLNRFDLLGWSYLKTYLSVGKYINNMLLGFLTTGTFLLIIGLLIFLSNFLSDRIENQKQKQMHYC